MTLSIRHSNIWKGADPAIRHAGVWKPVQEGYVRQGGIWKPFYQRYALPTFRAAATATGNGTISVARPGAVVEGDILCAVLMSSNVSLATAPGGWTQVASGAVGSVQMRVWTGVAPAGSGAFTFTTTGSSGGISVLAYSPGVGVDVVGTMQQNPSSIHVAAASIDVTRPGVLLAFLANVYGSPTTWPTGMTERVVSPGAPFSRVFDQAIEPGPTGIRRLSFATGQQRDTLGLLMSIY